VSKSGPDLELFRRWLQNEITNAQQLEDSEEKIKRCNRLDAALLLAIAFDRDWHSRREEGVAPTLTRSNVRVVQSTTNATPVQQRPAPSGQCGSCDAPLEDDLDFCPVCGKN